MSKNAYLGDVEAVIKRSQLFGSLDPPCVATLAAISVRKRFAAGESIFVQGDRCPGLYLVEHGLVRVFRSGAKGQQHVLHLCGPGQSFAEVAVLAGQRLCGAAKRMRDDTGRTTAKRTREQP